MVAATLAWYLFFVAHVDAFRSFGINHYGVWFLDTHAILASNDAVSRGLDPYIANPLDYFSRPHVYSHWWLGLRHLGLTRADNLEVGGAVVLLFLASAFAFLRPRSWSEVLWYILFLAAPPILVGLERANNDMLVFALLAPLVPCLNSRRYIFRMLAVILVALGVILKYYPIVAVPLLVSGTRGRTFYFTVLLIVVLVGGAAANVYTDFQRYHMASPDGLTSFGARQIFDFHRWHGPGPLAAIAGVVFLAALLSRSQALRGTFRITADSRDFRSFILGALLLTGCFFAGSSYAYRWVFALWLAPWLWRFGFAAPAAVRWLAFATAGLLVAAQWIDFFASAIYVFARSRHPGVDFQPELLAYRRWEQLIPWSLFFLLLVFIWRFLQQLWPFAAPPPSRDLSARPSRPA